MIKEKEILINDVISTIAYFDVFHYPLTHEQVYNFLPRNSVTQVDIAMLLEEMTDKKLIVRHNEFYCLTQSDRTLALERKQNELQARRLTRYARLVTRLLKWFPFIRGVFITGSLSKNVATKESDIDFMIVTAQGRLWICKTILTFFRRLFLLGNHKYFCTNYYVSERHYQYQERNIYSAIEIATLKAAWNTKVFGEYLEANGWIRQFLPNCRNDIDMSFIVGEKRVRFQKIVEAMLSVLPLNWMETVLMNYFSRHWSKRYQHLSAEKLDLQFHTEPHASSVWKNDQQEIILSRYHKKLHELGLQ